MMRRDRIARDCPAGGVCDEYPVLTMYFMRVAAWVGGNTTAGLFTANAVLLWICAAVIDQ